MTVNCNFIVSIGKSKKRKTWKQKVVLSINLVFFVSIGKKNFRI